jgi:hypothetical protein
VQRSLLAQAMAVISLEIRRATMLKVLQLG